MILSEAALQCVPPIKRSLSPSDEDRSQSKSPKSDRVFQCPYCTYTTDRKGSLTRHLRVHVVTADDVVPVMTPAAARYCANCDIQFSSFKTFTVHKQYYCNTRTVQKPSGTTTPNQPSPSVTPNSLPKTPLPTVTPAQLANQPLFAAISTNPLILIPCAYVPGSGLVPIQAGAGATTPDGAPISAGAIQVGGSSSPRPTSARSSDGGGGKEETILPDGGDEKKDNEGVKTTKKELGTESTPLDLSTTPKKDIKEERTTPLSNCGTPSSQDVEVATDLSNHSSSITIHKQQATFRCDDCNIVFYKPENFAAHKKHYCAARQPKQRVSVSGSEQENGDSDRPQTSSPLSRSKEGRSPSPRNPPSERATPKSESERNSATPGILPPTPAPILPLALPTVGSVGSQPVFQFYCIACGIKFTSLNNLQAHQTYYCPKREILQGTVRVGVMSRPVMEMQCHKCRITYPNEEQLKSHVCCARKCPYCDVYCSSHSAAQRHLATHAGIKAFKCTLCGYKGHTLRGMRTHVRIHVEKGAMIQEENFIICVGENGDPIPPPPSGANIMHFLAAKSPSLDGDGDTAERNSVTPTLSVPSVKSMSPLLTEERAGSPPKDTIQDNPDSPAKPEMHHWCNFCGYSSSYKGNVVRHIKLIHRDVLAGGLGQPQAALAAAAAAQLTAMNDLLTRNNNELIKRIRAEVEEDRPPSGGDVEPDIKVEEDKSEDMKHCNACDISFNYVSSFLAHKKYYCKAASGAAASIDGARTESPRCETPVSQQPCQTASV